MRISLIIAAGGSGSRFKAGLRDKSNAKTQPATKLFYPLGGVPILVRSLLAFQRVPEIRETIIALPPKVERLVQGWVKQYGLKNVICVRGGATRAESVQRAIRKASPRQNWIMIHDGARPLIQIQSIRALAATTRKKGWKAALLAKPVVPTIKQAVAGGNRVERTLDRSRLYEAETPQLFERKSLLRAYKAAGKLQIAPTDEALLLENAEVAVHLLPHSGWNPKITSVTDYELADAFLRKEEKVVKRFGFGSDTHRLIQGRPFWLGGVRLPSAVGPLGHSDGDALLHAVIDALLGAAGLGDIGDIFSDGDQRNKNRRSDSMLKDTLQRLLKAGYRPSQVDCVVHLERPKLGVLKRSMVQRMAKLMHLPDDCVSIKAKTFEGDGTGGAGQLIRCEALAVIQRS